MVNHIAYDKFVKKWGRLITKNILYKNFILRKICLKCWRAVAASLTERLPETVVFDLIKA